MYAFYFVAKKSSLLKSANVSNFTYTLTYSRRFWWRGQRWCARGCPIHSPDPSPVLCVFQEVFGEKDSTGVLSGVMQIALILHLYYDLFKEVFGEEDSAGMLSGVMKIALILHLFYDLFKEVFGEEGSAGVLSGVMQIALILQPWPNQVDFWWRGQCWCACGCPVDSADPSSPVPSPFQGDFWWRGQRWCARGYPADSAPPSHL